MDICSQSAFLSSGLIDADGFSWFLHSAVVTCWVLCLSDQHVVAVLGCLSMDFSSCYNDFSSLLVLACGAILVSFFRSVGFVTFLAAFSTRVVVFLMCKGWTEFFLS